MTSTMSGIRVVDGVLKDPQKYREEALKLDFRSYDFGHCVFHGIGISYPEEMMYLFGDGYNEGYHNLQPTLSFFRKSPLGQVEPHFIHTDADMGDWSAILYLNPTPPAGDGTNFWRHKKTGAFESSIPHERSEEGKDTKGWVLSDHVEGKFNRLLMFPSTYFHSRAIPENWGQGDDSRLTQVVFGKGTL